MSYPDPLIGNYDSNLSVVCEFNDKIKFNKCNLTNPELKQSFENKSKNEQDKFNNICNKNGGKKTECCDKSNLKPQIVSFNDNNTFKNYYKLIDSGKTYYFPDLKTTTF